MSEFSKFKLAIQRQFNSMKTGELFRTQAEGDAMWDEYLESFPSGSNPIFRERTSHDCSCCRQFVKAVGNIVAVVNNKLVSIWDVNLGEGLEDYQLVANAMARFVKVKPLENFFLHYVKSVGTDRNY